MRWQDYIWLLLLSGAFLAFYIANRKGRRRSNSVRRAVRPLTRREQKAWHLLQEGGYRLEEIHPSVPVTMIVGGKENSFNYEGDFIVSRGGESFLVKVIKGDSAPVRSQLRRELLLDSLFFQTSGIFFYHEEKGKLEEVRFAYGSAEGGGKGLLWKGALILLIIMGIVFLGHLMRGSIY